MNTEKTIKDALYDLANTALLLYRAGYRQQGTHLKMKKIVDEYIETYY